MLKLLGFAVCISQQGSVVSQCSSLEEQLVIPFAIILRTQELGLPILGRGRPSRSRGSVVVMIQIFDSCES